MFRALSIGLFKYIKPVAFQAHERWGTLYPPAKKNSEMMFSLLRLCGSNHNSISSGCSSVIDIDRFGIVEPMTFQAQESGWHIACFI